jgi:hypothetical protein
MDCTARYSPPLFKPYHRLAASTRANSSASDTTLVSSLTPAVFSAQSNVEKPTPSSRCPLPHGSTHLETPASDSSVKPIGIPINEILGPCFTPRTATATPVPSRVDTALTRLPTFQEQFGWLKEKAIYEHLEDSDEWSDDDRNAQSNVPKQRHPYSQTPTSPSEFSYFSDDEDSDDEFDYPGREITTCSTHADFSYVPLHHPKPRYPAQGILNGQDARLRTPHVTPEPAFPRPVQDLVALFLWWLSTATAALNESKRRG